MGNQQINGSEPDLESMMLDDNRESRSHTMDDLNGQSSIDVDTERSSMDVDTNGESLIIGMRLLVLMTILLHQWLLLR